MQCKDIPEKPVVEFVWDRNNNDERANWYSESERGVQHAMPELPNDKLALAKMRQLIKRGLIDGCGCGCRGDFVVTQAGCEFIGRERHVQFYGDTPI